jgi:hypothetical protein
VPAETIKKFTKVYPYQAGGVGTPIADFLGGKAQGSAGSRRRRRPCFTKAAAK